jgi:hypothetical protein
MSAQLKTILPLIAGGMLLAFGSAASASCNNGCHKPPVHKPPVHQPEHPGKPERPNKPNRPGNNFNVNVNVHANATAIATSRSRSNSESNSTSSSNSGSSGDTFFFGGGGSNVIATPGFPVIQRLNVMGDKVRTEIKEKRTVFKQKVVQAFCIDARGAPHPASRLTPDMDVREGFSGELFRCIAGTRLQATYADYTGKVAFDGGETIACAKGEALYHMNGALVCRTQTAQRNCFERSLLRRHGAGVKVFRMTKIEEHTSFKEEQIAHQSEIALDGGVGGFVF